MGDRPHRILVIDDDPGDAELLRRLLEDASGGETEVTTFTEPVSALAELESRGADLIFIDYLLGGQTGLEVFQAIREMGRVPVQRTTLYDTLQLFDGTEDLEIELDRLDRKETGRFGSYQQLIETDSFRFNELGRKKKSLGASAMSAQAEYASTD